MDQRDQVRTIDPGRCGTSASLACVEVLGRSGKNLPCFRIVMANVKQYLVNKLSSMLISIIQGSKLFSSIIGDMGILRSQIKIKVRHQNSPSHAHAKSLYVFRTHTLNSNRLWSSQLMQTITTFGEKLATILIKLYLVATGAVMLVNHNQ
jgi:hypothetical protein